LLAPLSENQEERYALLYHSHSPIAALCQLFLN
jgi:hypothetical protein